jgi:hypothetical protein
VLELKIEKDFKEETIMQVNGYLRTSMGTPSNLQRRSDHRTIVLALGGIGSGMTTSGTSTGSPGSSSSGSAAVPYARLRPVHTSRLWLGSVGSTAGIEPMSPI